MTPFRGCRLVTALLASLATAPAAHAFPSAETPAGGVVLHEQFVEVHAGSIPPGVVGLAQLDADGDAITGFGRNGFVVDRVGNGLQARGHVAIDDSGRILVAITPDG